MVVNYTPVWVDKNPPKSTPLNTPHIRGCRIAKSVYVGGSGRTFRYENPRIITLVKCVAPDYNYVTHYAPFDMLRTDRYTPFDKLSTARYAPYADLPKKL